MITEDTTFKTVYDKTGGNGFAITIDQTNLNQIKKYYMTTILSFFNDINFDIEYQHSLFLLQSVKLQIPMDLNEDFKNKFEEKIFKIKFNDEDNCIEVIFDKLPVTIELNIQIKKKETDKTYTRGKLYIAGIFEMINIQIFFQEDKINHLYKPKVYLSLKEFKVDPNNFKFFANLLMMPNNLIKGIIALLKKTIFKAVEDNLKSALPESITPMVNDLIDYYYPKIINIMEIGETTAEKADPSRD